MSSSDSAEKRRAQTVDEFAEELAFSSDSVRKLIRSGRFGAVNVGIGGKPFGFSPSIAKRFFASRASRPSPKPSPNSSVRSGVRVATPTSSTTSPKRFTNDPPVQIRVCTINPISFEGDPDD